MKQRFSSLDTHVIAAELASTIISLRLSNIYDLSSRIFLFKFASPGKRHQLLVDSGFRCHLTSFTRTASTFPSAFVQKLRKYLKSRRVTSVRQVGSDRVIEIGFSDLQYRLYLEFFAAGNVVLTDKDLNVLALLRQVNEGDENVDVRLGSRYVLEGKQNYAGIPPVSEERVKDALGKGKIRAEQAQEIGGKKAKRAKGADDLRKALSAGFPEYPAHLLEHTFITAQVDPSWKIQDVLESRESIEKIINSLNQANEVYKSLEQGSVKGYIIAKAKDGVEIQGTDPPRDALLYDDFHPFRPSQFESRPNTHILEFEGFNHTVDEFYSSIESQKLESRLTEREQQAEKKLQSAKDEHAKRLGALQQVQELHIRKAQAIEANTHRVEEACAAVNGLIMQGMDWLNIAKLIENEQGKGNVVAQMVKLPLKLEENTVTLLLDEPTFDEEESDEEDVTDLEASSDEEENITKASKPPSDKRLTIDIDLALTPWQNARQYYDQKKQAAVKEQKTMQASTRALQASTRKIQDDLKKGLKQEKAILQPTRRQFWFERFLWFISSEGYLVLGGKDAQQNELLYRRYLKKGDLYVHADLSGAASVIIKNNPENPDAPIPPSTLSQAGALTVCTSTAWESKAVMAAWWVEADQVSKTAPTGEYLQTGGFIIRGKKHFLPPSQLLLGFGMVWLVDEKSRANHGKNRVAGPKDTGFQADALAASTQDLQLDDEAENDDVNDDAEDVVPDVEEVGEAAEEEVEADNEAVNGDADEGEKDEEADDTVGDDQHDSEAEPERSNPLQLNGAEPSQADNGSVADEGEDSSDEDESAEAPDQATDSPRPDTPASSAPSSNQPKAQQLARGKRSKQKRAAKKYAEQDFEDRELAMQLLGSSKTQQKEAERKEEEEARRAKAEADKERRRKQHQRAAEREKVRQERIAAGETVAMVVEELPPEQVDLERQEHLNVDLLVPQPMPGDEIIAAIPMIAPFAALNRHKYKVKLQPGSVKKGKAVRDILHTWTSLGDMKMKGKSLVDENNADKERPWKREVELIRGLKMEEVVGNVPVKGCRVVQSAGAGSKVGGGGGGNKNKGGKGKGKGRVGGNQR
jgi:predicted ribosome quality control (RQC) complex YloA/Tae2 family protein